jgi:hypothetical protein
MNEQIEDAPDAPEAPEPYVKAVLPTGKAVVARLSHCVLEDQMRLVVCVLGRGDREVFRIPRDLELEPPVRIAVEHVGEYQDAL